MTMPELYTVGYQDGLTDERAKLRTLVEALPHNQEPYCVRCEMLTNLLDKLEPTQVPHQPQPAVQPVAPQACCEQCGNPKAHTSPDGNWIICDVCETHPQIEFAPVQDQLPTDTATPKDVHDWIAIGRANKWISEIYCDAHSGPPLSETELAEIDDTEEYPCVACVRVYNGADQCDDVERESQEHDQPN